MNFDNARIIVSTPNDGHVDPSSVAMSLAQLAKSEGASISRFNRALEINPLPSGEWDVVSEKGTVIAQHVVNAGGCFAPEVSAMVGASLPIVNLEHQYLVTENWPRRLQKKQAAAQRDSCRNVNVKTRTLIGRISGIHQTLDERIWARVGHQLC